MPNSWSVEEELMKLTLTGTIQDALDTLGLSLPRYSALSIEVAQPWFRSGAETYLLQFAIKYEGTIIRQCVMKACVTFSGIALSEVFAAWLSRRELVGKLNISTPKLYITGDALLVEEYIPLTLTDALSASCNSPALLRALGLTLNKLAKAGFRPVSIHDWRSRGDDVVLIDFGSDLGAPSDILTPSSNLVETALQDLGRAGVSLSTNEQEIITIAATSERAEQSDLS